MLMKAPPVAPMKKILICQVVVLALVASSSWSCIKQSAESLRDAAAKGDKSALQLLRSRAETGEASAQYNLGRLYKDGLGVPKDGSQATAWYTRAAEQNDAVAQNDLGVMYDYGDGVAVNHQEAIKWYLRAADQGNSLSQRNLGAIYYAGDGVPKNFVVAYKWWNLVASVPGNALSESARESRDDLERQMTPAQIEEAQQLSRQWKPKK